MFEVDKRLNYGRTVVKGYISSVPCVETALDIGAGEGEDLESVMISHPNCKTFAVEPFKEFQDRLVAKNIQPIAIDIERQELPFGNESFDLIIINQVLEHLKEIFWVLHNASRCLKQGGHLIIGVPNLASLHNRLLLLLGLQPTSIGNHSAHIRGYTHQDIKRVLDLGAPGCYEIRAARGSNFYPFPPIFAQKFAKLWPGAAVSRFYLCKKVCGYDGEFLRYPVEARLNTRFYIGGDASNEQWSS